MGKILKLTAMEDSRNRVDRCMVNWVKIVYTEFLKDNKGFSNPLAYIEGVYGDSQWKEKDRIFWAKKFRRAGHKVMKRNGIYYFEA